MDHLRANGFAPTVHDEDDMDTLKLFPIRMYLAARALRHREEGQAMVEYALILSLVSVAAVGILFTVGGKVGSIFTTISNDL